MRRLLLVSVFAVLVTAFGHAQCVWSPSSPCPPATPATGATPFPDTGSFLQNFFVNPVKNRIGTETNSGARMVFATDPTHPCDGTNNNSSWVTASFGYMIEWSAQSVADHTAGTYYLMVSSAPDASIVNPCLVTFNYNTFQVTATASLSSLHLTPGGSFDQVTPHIWYAPSNQAPFQIYSVDVSNLGGGRTLVVDLSSSANCPNIPSLTTTTNGEITRSYGITNLGRFGYWGNGNQDSATIGWINDPTNGCMWLNMASGDINAATNWGMSTTTCSACVPSQYRTNGANKGLHRAYLDADGKTLWFENQNFAAGKIIFTIPPPGAWPSGASMFSECDVASPVLCGNHVTFYPGGFVVNGAGNTGAGSNQRVADRTRPVSNPGSAGSGCTPVNGYEDDLTNFNVGTIAPGTAAHDSSPAGDSALANYFWEGTYMNDGGTGHVTNAWQQELDLVSANPCAQNRWRLMATHLKSQVGSMTAGLAGGSTGISTDASGNATVTTLGPHGFNLYSITSWSITSNVATFQATNSLSGGSWVGLSGFGTSTFFNGTVAQVTSGNPSQFSINFTHANGSATETGNAGDAHLNAYNCNPSSFNNASFYITAAASTTAFVAPGFPVSSTADCMFDNPAVSAQDFYASFLPNATPDNRLGSVPENSERTTPGDPFRNGFPCNSSKCSQLNIVIIDAGFSTGGLTFTPSPLTFNPQQLSTTSAGQTVTITNNLASTITLTSEVMQTGTQFAISANTCGASLTVGASCTVTITFTPNAANNQSDALVVTSSAPSSPQQLQVSGIGLAVPGITPVTGSYAGSQTVTITDATIGSSIYFTTNATTPTCSSTLYTGSFQVNSTTTVEAIACLSGVATTAATSVITITSISTGNVVIADACPECQLWFTDALSDVNFGLHSGLR